MLNKSNRFIVEKRVLSVILLSLLKVIFILAGIFSLYKDEIVRNKIEHLVPKHTSRTNASPSGGAFFDCSE